jgi:hypothetical protein
MRDPLTTRRLLAKIDREADLYVVADRMRQAIYDLDDYTGRLDARINALEQEKAEFLKESGVHRVIQAAVAKEAIDWGRWAVRGTLAAVALTLAGWILKLAWKGFHG